MTRLKLDQWGSRWSFARGATKATHRTKGQSMTELTDALAEVDGLLAGINYLEKLEPESEDTHFPSVQSDKDNHLPTTSAKGSWLSHLTFDLPQLDASAQEKSKIETRHLRNILNDKLISSSENPRRMPHKSQWATLRSLRKASMYHYSQFTKVTADSTSAEIRKLRKSYVTAKNMLEMGILTFRDVVHGHTPSTLVDIFAFASLSYVISKTLHSNGHLDESDILSGILDWRAAIVDVRERAAFDEIAKQLWPEAQEIMHFFPVESRRSSPSPAGLRRDGSEVSFAPSPVQEAWEAGSSKPGEDYMTSQGDPLPASWADEYASILQSNSFPLSEAQDISSELRDHARQLVQETKSHEDFMFSAWLNLDGTLLDDGVDPFLCQNMTPNSDPGGYNSSQAGCSSAMESAPSESRGPSHGVEECPLLGYMHTLAETPTLDQLLNTHLFQVVFRFVIHISEAGDLLNVLSGRGLTSQKGGIISTHSRPPWAALEFLDQVPRQFFGSLHREAAQIHETFSGIVAMAEMFVRLGSLQTIKEVEDYVITVGRYLTHSYDLFTKLVSNTLIQCLFASKRMKWNLLYPDYVQEADEYSIEYINRREKAEQQWATSNFTHIEPSEELSSTTKSPNASFQKDPPNIRKRAYQDKSGSDAKRRRRNSPSPASQSPVSGTDVSTIEHCPFDTCSKSYTGNAALNNLSRHVRTEHQKKMLKCPNCGKEIRRRDNLRQHFLKIHSTSELPDWIANKGRGLRD